jgi:hypothetical protein
VSLDLINFALLGDDFEGGYTRELGPDRFPFIESITLAINVIWSDILKRYAKSSTK